jgi:CMP-N-acetylneuraminic acid synthetase
LYKYNLRAAWLSGIYDQVYVITDYDYDELIVPPKQFIKEDTSKYKKDGNHHYEAILQGLEAIEKIHGKLDYLTILLGNCRGGATPQSLSSATHSLMERPTFDSCVSVSCFNMFNPFRAYKDVNGSLKNWIDPDVIKENKVDLNDKNAFEDTYFFNGGFWIVKRDVLVANNGIPPFTWLGKKIMPYVQAYGIMELDSPWQLKNVL